MIIQFDSETQATLSDVGGKALSLIRMTRAGLPVPPGFVLPVAFFAPWIDTLKDRLEWDAVQTALHDGDDLAPATDALKAACERLRFTAAQEQQLDVALASLPKGGLFAVRSSSPEEDLAGASFAGGYETTLGVTATTLPDAVRHSFASAFDERVFVYKAQHGFAVDQPRIAVIVQQQIAAERAGVGFSLNPITNDYDEAVIDANWGLGETVVSGTVEPDHVVINKVTRAIVEQQCGSKATAIWLDAAGGTSERADPRRAYFALNRWHLLALVDLLVQIDALYEQPMDIEWAFADGTLYVLQARPITAYIPLVPSMQTQPGARRTLYMDAALTEGITTNAPHVAVDTGLAVRVNHGMGHALCRANRRASRRRPA